MPSTDSPLRMGGQVSMLTARVCVCVCVCVRVRACSFCAHACVLCVCVCVHRARLHPDLQQSAAADCTGAGGVQGKLDIPIGLGQATLVLNTAFPRI